MKAAFAVWNNRIAPVFDVARQIYVIDVVAEDIVNQQVENLPDGLPTARVGYLVGHQVTVLVCGAISRTMEMAITGYGIQVIAFVAGDWQEVATAWLTGRIGEDDFAMPGCCGRKRRCRWRGNGCRHD